MNDRSRHDNDFDFSAALVRMLGEIDIYRSFSVGFIADGPDWLQRVSAWVTDGQFECAAEKMHRLKGVAAQLGCLKLHGLLASGLEEFARSGEIAEITLRETESAYRSALISVAAFLQLHGDEEGVR